MNTERCIRSGEWSIHLEHFQYMLEIDRCRSISAAARSLGLVQTTLSSIVKNVESALGFPIFQRTPNGVAPTVFGEQFLTLGGEIHVRFEELLRLKSGVSGSIDPIHILCAPSINLGAALPLAQRFYQFFNYGTLVFEECPRLEILPQILQRLTNIGITYLTEEDAKRLEIPLAHEQIYLKLLYRDRFYAFLPPDSPLGTQEVVDVHRLCEENVAVATNFRFIPDREHINLLDVGQSCFPSDGNSPSLLFDAAVSRQYRSAGRFTSFPNIRIVKRAVEEQKMVSILTGYAICEDQGYPWNRACIRPLSGIEGQGKINIYVCYRTEQRLRYQERIILSCIEEYFSALTPPPFAMEEPSR